MRRKHNFCPSSDSDTGFNIESNDTMTSVPASSVMKRIEGMYEKLHISVISVPQVGSELRPSCQNLVEVGWAPGPVWTLWRGESPCPLGALRQISTKYEYTSWNRRSVVSYALRPLFQRKDKLMASEPVSEQWIRKTSLLLPGIKPLPSNN